MKKSIYSIAALCIALFASCVEETFDKPTLQSTDEISFTIDGMSTRGAQVTTENLSSVFTEMNVVAVNFENQIVFSDQLDLTQTGEKMKTDGNHYWPTTDEAYDFFVLPSAVSDYISSPTYSNGVYSFTYSQPSEGDNDGVNAPDLILAHSNASKNTNNGMVSLNFEHALTAIHFKYVDAKAAHKISEIKISNAYSSADCTFDTDADNMVSWSNYYGSETLSQVVDDEIYKVDPTEFGLKHNNNAATFMLIPGGTGKITFSVIIDGKEKTAEFDHSALVPGGQINVLVTDGEIETTANNVNANKKYTQNGNTWNLTLEAWTTGVTTISAQPADIAILVDVSGSMDELMSDVYKQIDNYSFSYGNVQGYYYSDDKEHYYKVNREWEVAGLGTGLRSKTYLSFEKNGHTYYLSGTTVLDSKPSVSADWFWNTYGKTLYTGTLFYRPTRMEATRDAINTFIAEVNSQSSALKKGEKHQISLVKFAGESKSGVGNDFNGNSNYSQIVCSWSDPNSEDLATSVDELKAGGATSADYGMAHVVKLFNSARANTAKVVVMLTDGEPNHNNGFTASVANSTISSAKSLKDKGVKIWSVYVGDNLYNGSVSNATNIINYMEGVSSNYPSATGYLKNNLGARDDSKYFTNATEPEHLNKVFTSVAESVAAGVMDKSTEIRDIFSSAFELPTTENVNVSFVTYNCSAYDATNDLVTSWSDSPNEATGVSYHFEGSSLVVTGFDFNANYCGINSNRKVVGKKLVINVTGLTPKDGATPGEYLTNGYGSGIYVGGELISSFANTSEGKNTDDSQTIVIR